MQVAAMEGRPDGDTSRFAQEWDWLIDLARDHDEGGRQGRYWMKPNAEDFVEALRRTVVVGLHPFMSHTAVRVALAPDWYTDHTPARVAPVTVITGVDEYRLYRGELLSSECYLLAVTPDAEKASAMYANLVQDWFARRPAAATS